MKNFIKKYWWLLVVIAISTNYIYLQTRSPADYCEEQQRYLTNEELTQGLADGLAGTIKDKTENALKSTGLDVNTTEFFQKYPHLIWVDRNASAKYFPISVNALYFFTPDEKKQFNQKWRKVLEEYYRSKPPSERPKYKTVVGISYEQALNGCGRAVEPFQMPWIDYIEENEGRYAKQNPYQNNLK
ncbi:MAG: hypothetical protein OEL19_06565 [Sulfurimonas sp.]|nr:hypothetical protein [Sulfurimonas sp.]